MPYRAISLNGEWSFRNAKEKKWLPAAVPGCVHTDLMRAGVIGDAGVGTEELNQLWIAEEDWEYTRRFRVPKDFARQGARLVFQGLDTAAAVHLNGKLLGRTCNMHRRFTFDVTNLLRRDNEIRVRFASPLRTAQRLRLMDPRIDPFPYDRKWPFGPDILTCRNFLRKAQYQFGWDWGLYQPTSGIWRNVRLEAGEILPDYLTARQFHRSGRVRVEATLRFTATGAGTGRIAVSVWDGHPRLSKRKKPAAGGGCATQATTEEIRWKKGENAVTLAVEVNDPKLWWPRGLGKQPLYLLEAKIGSGGALLAEKSARIGLRTVELVRKPDQAGESFGFRVNGASIYIRGVNWVPPSTLPSSVAPADYRFLVHSAAAANMNLIRVWGGGIYEPEYFYSLCDELGLMVWQDHLMACSAYPAVPEFARELEAEITHNIRRLHAHPSIVLWCGDNEDEVANTRWFRESPNHRHMLRSYYRLMEETVAKVTRREDPDRPFRLSSPSSGNHRDPGSHDRGDAHVWDVWMGDLPFARHLEARPRFASEFGYESFPHARTLRNALRGAELNPVSAEAEYHERFPGGNVKITNMLAKWFRLPADFDSFCYVSQLLSGVCVKLAVEHWRRIKPHCRGTIYWQLADTWPVVSHASIDSSREWKALHYFAKRFYSPLLASMHPMKLNERCDVEAWLTSDLNEGLSGRWTLELCGLDGSKQKVAGGEFRLRANESRRIATFKALELSAGYLPEQRFLVLRARAGKYRSENFHFFAPFKWLELPKARVKVRVRKSADNGLRVKVSTDATALFVELASAKVPGVFSDNYFHLLAGESREVKFFPREDAGKASLARFRAGVELRSLVGSY